MYTLSIFNFIIIIIVIVTVCDDNKKSDENNTGLKFSQPKLSLIFFSGIQKNKQLNIKWLLNPLSLLCFLIAVTQVDFSLMWEGTI